MRWKHDHTILLLLVITLLPLGTNAQSGYFKKILGGPDPDAPYDIVTTPDGGFLIAGGSGNYSWADGGQAMLFRTDSAGNALWNKGYGGENTETFYALKTTSDSGFVAYGVTNSFGQGAYDMYLIRVDGQGDTLWSRTYGGSDWEEGHDLVRFSDDGMALLGTTHSFGKGGADLYLLRTTASGDTLWTQTIGTPGHETGEALVHTQDDGLVAVGSITPKGQDTTSAYVVKTDNAGQVLWDTVITKGYETVATTVTEKDNGEIVMTINARDSSDGSWNIYVTSLDPSNNGQQVWEQSFISPGNNQGHAVLQTPDGGIAHLGSTDEYGSGKMDGLIFKGDHQGFFQWSTTFGGPKDDETYCVTLAKDSGLVSAGHTSSFGNSPKSIFLFKADKQGQTASNEEVLVGTEAIRSQTGRSLTIFPQPADAQAHLSFTVSPEEASRKITLQITDLQGRTLLQEEPGKTAPGVQQVTVNTSELPEGMYLIRLWTGKKKTTRKLLIRRP